MGGAARNYVFALHRAAYRERKRAALALLDDIIRRESIWWVHEPGAGRSSNSSSQFSLNLHVGFETGRMLNKPGQSESNGPEMHKGAIGQESDRVAARLTTSE